MIEYPRDDDDDTNAIRAERGRKLLEFYQTFDHCEGVNDDPSSPAMNAMTDILHYHQSLEDGEGGEFLFKETADLHMDAYSQFVNEHYTEAEKNGNLDAKQPGPGPDDPDRRPEL